MRRDHFEMALYKCLFVCMYMYVTLSRTNDTIINTEPLQCFATRTMRLTSGFWYLVSSWNATGTTSAKAIRLYLGT